MKKVPLKVVRVLYPLLYIISAIILFCGLGSGTYNPVTDLLGSALLVFNTIFAMLFWKCPKCGKTLPIHTLTVTHCPHCGEDLGLDEL